ncbi:hypothetical protein NE237_002077 [Protea cynaroides]|uniref:Uncharacterized protein n=1 Tax=Protea cynaroides TaxID=273540 RepID=A0A9Q0KVD5_9MAGN|nr:hypothetical protein NE237_002077 [Protea cynaroides]
MFQRGVVFKFGNKSGYGSWQFPRISNRENRATYPIVGRDGDKAMGACEDFMEIDDRQGVCSVIRHWVRLLGVPSSAGLLTARETGDLQDGVSREDLQMWEQQRGIAARFLGVESMNGGTELLSHVGTACSDSLLVGMAMIGSAGSVQTDIASSGAPIMVNFMGDPDRID